MNYPKKTLAVFAHPDDEAFGPGGTIIKLAQAGTVDLVCVTNGQDPNGSTGLDVTRAQELKRSAAVLGINPVHFLNYPDGHLCNANYHEVAKKIDQLVQQFKPELLLTYEPRGISGHIDHVALSHITSYVFEHSTIPKQVWYYCISEERRDRIGPYFIYFPPGYKPEEIDITIDVSDVWDQKVKAMHCHITQIEDVKRILKERDGLPKDEHFLIRSR